MFSLKSGTNKGNRRIWIEGVRLLDAGLTRGTKLHRLIVDGVMYISTSPMTGATCHTVAGTPTRPIIDFNGKWLTAFMAGAEYFTVVCDIAERGAFGDIPAVVREACENAIDSDEQVFAIYPCHMTELRAAA